MGLGITVGVLADLIRNDPEGAEIIRRDFAEIRRAMLAAGLASHSEPEECDVWFADGMGYSGLHALREVAGFVWKGLQVPRTPMLTGQETPHSDELYEAAVPFLFGKDGLSLWQRLVGRKNGREPSPFMHLVCHGDAEGYYVPTDFEVPLIPLDDEDTTVAWPLGSVQRLRAEIAVLSQVLDIPRELTPQSPDLTVLLEHEQPNEDGALWQAQPIATYSALILRDACDASLSTGAAISFG